jgi:membrane associated rhomboid family serine protease
MDDLKPPPTPIINAPRAVLLLCASLVLTHAARVWSGAGDALLYQWAFAPVMMRAEPWRMVTYIWLHGDWMHVTLNSLGALAFGTAVYRRLGWRCCFALFAMGGSGAAVAMALLDPTNSTPMVGASAAVAALMGATSRVLSPSHRIAPLRDRTVVGMAVGWLVANGVLFLIGKSLVGAEVAWQAHLIGYAIGLIFCPLFGPRSRGY